MSASTAKGMLVAMVPVTVPLGVPCHRGLRCRLTLEESNAVEEIADAGVRYQSYLEKLI